MRQNFSYILCAVFMLFGTSQILQGMSLLTKAATESLDLSFNKVAAKLGEDATFIGLNSLKRISGKLEAELDAKMQALSSKFEGASVEAFAAVRSAMQRDIVKSIISRDARLIEGDLLTKTLSEAGAKASGSVEDLLKDLKPSDADFPIKFQAASDAAAELKLSKPLPVKPEVKIPAAKPEAAVNPPKPYTDLESVIFSAKSGDFVGAAQIAGKSIANTLKDVNSFMESKAVGVKNTAIEHAGYMRDSTSVKTAIEHAGYISDSKSVKILLGKPKQELRDVFETPPSGGQTFKDFSPKMQDEIIGRYPKDPVTGRSPITDKTIFDKDGNPVENSQALQNMGVPKFKKVGDPVYETNAKGDPLAKQFPKLDEKGNPLLDAEGKPVMGYKPIPKQTLKDVLGADGKPVNWGLKDVVGDSPAVKFIGSSLKSLLGGVKMIAVQGMVMGMAMSVPNSLMAGFTAERVLQAQLATIAAPIQFGGMVMQIPDELMNYTIPSNSLKIYVGIPVTSATSTIGGGASSPSATNMVVGPNESNPTSTVIASLAKDQFKAFMSTLMSAANEMGAAGDSSHISRYTFFQGDSTNASYYDSAHLLCSYSPLSYIPWASSAITDPGFPGLMIDLNTGYICAADGTTQGNDPAVLFGITSSGSPISVGKFLSNYKSNLDAQNKTFDFAQYTSGGQPDVDVHAGGSIIRQFSSACIMNLPTDKLLAGGAGSGFGDICMVGNFRNSVIATSLMRLAAGVCIDQNGKEIILAPPALPSSSSQSQYVASNSSQSEAINSALASLATKAGQGVKEGVNAGVKAVVDRVTNELGSVSTQLLNITAGNAAAKDTAAKAAKDTAAKAAQIAGFYDDPNQKTNFAMQSQYVPEQTTFANDVYSKFTLSQQNLFATFALAQATSDQQQSFIDTVYNGLSAAQKAAFAKQLATFKDNASILLYVFSQATSAQQKTFMDAVFSSLSPMQKRAFIQDPQFVTTAQLQTFANGIYNKAEEFDINSFAENVLAIVNQSQNQQQALASGTSGVAAYQVLHGSNANEILQDAIAKGALGGVVPIYGFDSGFQNFINTHFAKAAAQLQAAGGLQPKISGHVTTASQISNLSSGSMQSVGVNSNDSAAGKASGMLGGSNLNYPAFGVYIYECENTPFATELARLTNTQALDYIVFLDVNLNCVPLQVVAPSSAKFNFPEYKLNPAIAYWASLICYIGNGNGPLDEFMGRYQDTSGAIQTFFPLYTMLGDLAYVQGASNAMDGVMSSLQKPNQNFPVTANIVDLYNQIVTVAKLEVATYQFGPFYKPYNLEEADQKMWMTKASTNASIGSTPVIDVVPYKGMPPFPMTLNLGSTSGPTDYLIPFVKEGGQLITVQLPNPYVEMFVSLVTDITFTANFDKVTGNTTFVPASYKDSAYNLTTGLDVTKISTYTWLNNFKKQGVTIPDALKTDVEAQRAAWVAFIQSNKNDPTFMAQAHGFPFGQQNHTLSLAYSDDYANGNYMYYCSSSPSGIAEDLYVMSATAALPNATVGQKANPTKLQPYIVSLATGFMYDATGKVVKGSTGKPVSMDVNQLLGLVNKNQGGKALSTNAQTHLKQIILEGQKILNALQGPYEFGDLILHLYEIDVANSNYVYFTLNQLGNPSDYFVVVKSAKPPFVFGGSIDGATQSMVSLITGELYTRTGTAGTWPDLDTLLSAVKNTMSISAVDSAQIDTLNAAFKAQRSAEAIQKSEVDKQAAAAKAQVLEDMGNLAANVIVKPYLPAPYDTLVKDALGKYYRVTPDSDGKPFMIFDFKAASKDGSDIGAMFMADGTFVTIMDGIHLVGMRQQFGVQVDSKGVQTLTIPHITGNMNLSDADQKIVPGSSGTALLVSTDAQFPTPGISKIVSGTKTYHFYYHTFLHSYFVYMVDSASKEQYYISMNDGTAYNSDGSARILHYQVARGTKGDPMIITQSTDGMLSATFADPGTSSKSVQGKYMHFMSDSAQFVAVEDDSYRPKQGMYGVNVAYGVVAPNNAVYIYQDFPDQYGNMKFNPNAQTYLLHYADGTICEAFTLEAASQVQALTYIPVSPKTGQIITTPVTDILKTADFILQQGSIVEVIFNGAWYKASAGGAFTSASGGTITVKAIPATQSCAAYAVISQGAQDYVYSYAYQTLSDADFTQYKQAVWLMNAAMSPMAKAVLCKNFNPAAGKSIAVAKDAATNAVPSNVKNVPDSLVPGITVNIKTIKFDQVSGKYFVPIAAADYDYFGQDGFVDIENGCIYDIKGIPYGYSLVLPDYVALLNKLNVMVEWDINLKRYNIVYRSGQLVK